MFLDRLTNDTDVLTIELLCPIRKVDVPIRLLVHELLLARILILVCILYSTNDGPPWPFLDADKDVGFPVTLRVGKGQDVLQQFRLVMIFRHHEAVLISLEVQPIAFILIEEFFKYTHLMAPCFALSIANAKCRFHEIEREFENAVVRRVTPPLLLANKSETLKRLKGDVSLVLSVVDFECAFPYRPLGLFDVVVGRGYLGIPAIVDLANKFNLWQR